MRCRLLFYFVAVCPLLGGFLSAAEEEESKGGEHTIYLRDFGGHDTAFLRLPEEAPSAGVVLLPGRIGLDPVVKDICRVLAGKQLITLAVDVYAGRTAKTEEEWEFVQSSLDAREIVGSVASGCRFFRESPRFHADRIILIGAGRQAEALLSVAPDEKAVAGVVLMDPDFSTGFKWPEKPLPPVLLVRTAKRGEPEAVWAAVAGEQPFQTVEVPRPLLGERGEKAWLPVLAFIETCLRPEPSGGPFWKKLFKD
jgi:dienelactone hydrolase